jgi:tetratricopeptide (TPR) repeat protein
MKDDNPQYFDLIQTYIDGEMSPAEAAKFEQDLHEKIDLKKEYDLYLALQEGIKRQNIEVLKEQFKKIDQQLDAKASNSVSRTINFRLISIAASVVLIIALSFYFTAGNNEVSIAKTFWEEDRGLKNLMGTSLNNNEKMEKAMNFYKLGEYDKATSIFETMKYETKNDTVSYYSAILNFKKDKFEEAILGFKSVVSKKESIFIEKAEYRLALSYLAAHHKEEAKEVISKIISDQNHLYFDQASDLSKEIKD